MKFYKKKEKVFKPIRVNEKPRKSLKPLVFSIIFFIFLVLFFGILYLVNDWFDKNKFVFQAPITFHMPIQIVKRTPPDTRKVVEVPAEKVQAETIKIKDDSPKGIIMSYKHGEILWKVYGLESSFGRNDGCSDQGKFNGFGYAQSTFSWQCFQTFDEVAGKVNTWFEKRFAEGYTLNEALCYYNQGIRESNCPYAQNYTRI